MSELTELKDLIRERYGSQANCADAMGFPWTKFYEEGTHDEGI